MDDAGEVHDTGEARLGQPGQPRCRAREPAEHRQPVMDGHRHLRGDIMCGQSGRVGIRVAKRQHRRRRGQALRPQPAGVQRQEGIGAAPFRGAGESPVHIAALTRKGRLRPLSLPRGASVMAARPTAPRRHGACGAWGAVSLASASR